MKKILLVIAILIVGLAGCNQDSSNDTLTIWAWDQNLPAVESAIEQWKSANPDSDVKFDVQNVPDTVTKLDLLFASGAGESADLVLADNNQIQSWIQKYPDELVNISAMGYDDNKDFFSEGQLNVLSDNKDDLYALPFDVGPVIMLYNVDLMNELGFNPDEITTWDKYLEVTEVALEKGYKMNASNTLDFNEFLRTAGLSAFDEKDNIDLLNPEVVEVSELYRKLVQNGGFDPAVTETAWQDGTAVSFIRPAWAATEEIPVYEASNLNISAQKIPAITEGGSRAMNDGGSSWVIPTKSENQAIAYEIATLITTSPESQQAAFDAGLMPGWSGAKDLTGFDQKVAIFNDEQIYLLLLEVSEELDDMYISAYTAGSKEYIQNNFVDLASGEKSTKELLEETANAIKQYSNTEINQY